MSDEINRLGFDAWCDNKFVNAIEDCFRDGSGEVVTETSDCTMRLAFTHDSITCVIRKHTPEGWKTYEKEFKRPKNRA